MAQIIPFPRRTAASPVMIPVVQYYISIALIGLIAIAVIDGFMAKR